MRLRVAGAALFCVFMSSFSVTELAFASSHREAPYITEIPKLDGTDFYMFRSYEAGRADYVTLLANYVPLQDPFGGPNYFFMDEDALFEIHIDNDGDAKEDLTFQFDFETNIQGLSVPAGGKNVPIPLINLGAVGATGSRADVRNLNLQETYEVTLVRGDRRLGKRAQLTSTSGEKKFRKPGDNIGTRSYPKYDAYANDHIYTVKVPGCNYPGKLFVGQRKEPFAVNLGQAFDLINTATLNPDGTAKPFVPAGEAVANAGPNSTDKKSVTTLALELPIACVVKGKGSVIGGWTTSSLPKTRLLNHEIKKREKAALEAGNYVQVSRLGMPLVNELVIGLPDKDRFNNSEPKDDAQFLDYVTNPSFPELIEVLFGPKGVAAPLGLQAPNLFPRADLVATFLTGIKLPGTFNNMPEKGKPSEMLRLDTSVKPVSDPTKQSRLGVIGGDAAGFPNGRRPGDDIVDVVLQVAIGKLVNLGLFGKAVDAPSGNVPLVDGALVQATDFNTKFPYLRSPLPGNLTD
jgi:hypothetical protein